MKEMSFGCVSTEDKEKFGSHMLKVFLWTQMFIRHDLQIFVDFLFFVCIFYIKNANIIGLFPCKVPM